MLLPLALVACTKTTSKPDEPAPAVVPAVAPKPVPAATATSWLEAVSAAPVENGPKVDVTALGASVEAQLVERGGAADADADRTELELVLTSPAGRRVIGVAGHDTSGGDLPLGTVRGVTALSPPRRYRAEDGFEDAPRFRSKAPVVFVWSIDAYPGDHEHYVITHDRDTLVVWLAERVYEEGPTQTWEKRLTVRLAAGAIVTTPKVDDAAGKPSIDATTPMHVRETTSAGTGDSHKVSFELVVGKTRGALGHCSVATKSEAIFAGEHTWTAKPIAPPPPVTGTIVATRSCLDTNGQQESFTLERRGEDVVLWKRSDDGEWFDRWLTLKASDPE